MQAFDRPSVSADATSLLMRHSAAVGGLPNQGDGDDVTENGNRESRMEQCTHSLTPSGHQLTPSAINATSQSARPSVCPFH